MPEDPILAIERIVEKLTLDASSGSGNVDLKGTTALLKQHQQGIKEQGEREAGRRKDILTGVTYLGGLVFLASAMIVFLAYTPSNKRIDLIEKLVPVLTAALGYVFGSSRSKSE